ncbi:MAG: dockerin type I repeat-containing protein [Euryarchaeota archaeon]|nr:dockerin type I repeat-containing protein [Euryarchaeota archaeon]
MRTKRILFGILVLFAVLALSANSLHAAEQESGIMAVSSIGTLDGSGFGITDDFAVTGDCVEIGYDDSTAEDGIAPKVAGVGMAVHFTIANPDCNRLKTARFALILNESVSDNSFDWKVLKWTGSEPGSELASGTTDPAEHGWCGVDMGNIDVPKEFVIAMYSKQELAPYLGCDENSTLNDRGLLYSEGQWYAWPLEQNLMIRAVVCDGNGEDPDIDVTPVEIEARLEPGESVSKTLNICNKGDGVLTYSSISISYDAKESKTAAIGALGLEKIGKGVGAISAGEEIRYDDGDYDGAYYFSTVGFGMGVHFTVTNPDQKTLETARFCVGINDSVSSNSFDWKVLGWTGSMPGSVIASGTTTPVEDGWHDVDVGDIAVPDDFVIAMYWRQGHAPVLGYDNSTPIDKRSWDYMDTWSRWDNEDYMIRAVMGSETTPPPPEDKWLSVDKTSGTVVPGNCDEIAVMIDATDLETGRYSATIVISSDDPDEGTVTVPVTLDMVDNGSLMEGDVNGDGCVSLKDSTAIKLSLVGKKDLTADQIKCADTNDDDEVSLKDSTLIRKWLVDKSTKLWESPADDPMKKPVAC